MKEVASDFKQFPVREGGLVLQVLPDSNPNFACVFFRLLT